MNTEYGCEVKYFKCYNVKRISMRRIYKDADEEYSKVKDDVEAI